MIKLHKIFTLFIIFTGLIVCSHTNSFADSTTVKVNDDVVQFDSEPYINEDGRMMVPLRFIASKMGALIYYDNRNQVVPLLLGNTSIILKINDNYAYVSLDTKKVFEKDANAKTIIPVYSSKKLLDTKTVIKNNRTYVPLRFIAENFGAKVQWDNNTKTVLIYFSGIADNEELSIDNWIYRYGYNNHEVDIKLPLKKNPSEPDAVIYNNCIDIANEAIKDLNALIEDYNSKNSTQKIQCKIVVNGNSSNELVITNNANTVISQYLPLDFNENTFWKTTHYNININPYSGINDLQIKAAIFHELLHSMGVGDGNSPAGLCSLMSPLRLAESVSIITEPTDIDLQWLAKCSQYNPLEDKFHVQ